jgi:hypothetical protein
VRPGELVRSIAASPVKTVRKIPKAALTRIRRALEERGMITMPWEVPASRPAEEMVAAGDRWGPSAPALPGIELSKERQLHLLEQMRRHATDLPDFHAGSFHYRYQPKGSPLPLPEALSLYLMLRVLSPKRVAAIGSKEGRAVILDTVDRSFERAIEVGTEWRRLAGGDVLWVESAEPGELVFEMLPGLSAGVFVGLSPIAYPFREAPLLRAFLMYNRDFQIRFWPSYLYQHQRDRLACIPQICADARVLWIRKVS